MPITSDKWTSIIFEIFSPKDLVCEFDFSVSDEGV